MAEFQNAVNSLLDTFTHGLSIIRNRRKRKAPANAAETTLSKSLKQSKSDVRDRYKKDLARHGKVFATGDVTAQAYLSLNSILARLNAGFLAVLERFTKGKSTPADYDSLINLSNASRIETIKTFEQLSVRLSKSSLSLPSPKKGSTATNHTNHSGQKHKSSRSTVSRKKWTGRSKNKSSSSEVSQSLLGPAKQEGWIRPKTSRKASAESVPSSLSPPTATSLSTNPKPKLTPVATSISPSPLSSSSSSITPTTTPPRPHRKPLVITSKTTRNKRISFMSFASDSTKLGEIPPHKWAQPPLVEDQEVKYPIIAYYPLDVPPFSQQQQQERKQRGGIMRLFKKRGA
ncbi:hypothetical protein F5884DRAFT_192548 [Xylogone sp. PMI_703]|nr:hypothetical protein F5884DRAFT_192548 [Xylogone sp. PMI_703]